MRHPEDDVRVRPGRIKARGESHNKRFVNQVLKAAQKAGGVSRRKAAASRRSTFGRGRSASVAARRGLTVRSRLVTVKARVVRRGARPGGLAAHVLYLQRDGVTKEGVAGRLFGAGADQVNGRSFAEHCGEDRHHFRFIVSPQDAVDMEDLKAFTRDLMTGAERDLGTRLEWVAVEHHNTEHPHVHVLVRGRADDGGDLVISRDYIREGLRARAQTLVTLELGPRTDLEIRRGLESQVDAERWTVLDRDLVARAARHDGVVDLRPDPNGRADFAQHARLGRMQKLERLGLATSIGPAQWTMSDVAETTLRDLGERNDIIKRLHRNMRERSSTDWVLAADRVDTPVVGRLVSRGLDDELKGSAFAIVDGIDGRAHHLRLPDLEATCDASSGAIVEMRRFTDAGGRDRVALAVRSDLAIEAQVTADGATWLDRRLVARDALPLSEGGFGGEVREAMERRTNHLIAEGLARRQGQRVVFARDLLETLRERELESFGHRLASETGATFHSVLEGEAIAGVYKQRVSLASGRFAMIGDGLGFSLVPWTPAMELHLGKEISGVAAGTGVDWSFGKKRGLGI